MITKLPLDVFIRPEFLPEAYSMQTPEEQESAYKQSLLDTLRYMQAVAFKVMAMPGDKSNLSFAFQKYLANLDLIQKFFETAVNNPTLASLVDANKKAFVTAVNSGTEFKPILWNRNLDVEIAKLPPKYMNTASVPAPQYRGGSKFYGDDSPLTDKIALDTSR